MKAKLILMSCLAAALSWAGGPSVTLCFNLNPEVEYKIQAFAEGYATRIYQPIGIDLRWKIRCTEDERNAPGTDRAPNLTTIGIEWIPKAPPTIPSQARALALPFQATGERVLLFLDRIMPVLQEREFAAAILGHILAHEIGHVLMGQDAHTSHGLMKGVWNNLEQTEMLYRPMQFTQEDAAQIHRRLRGSLASIAANR